MKIKVDDLDMQNGSDIYSYSRVQHLIDDIYHIPYIHGNERSIQRRAVGKFQSTMAPRDLKGGSPGAFCAGSWQVDTSLSGASPSLFWKMKGRLFKDESWKATTLSQRKDPIVRPTLQ